MRYAILVCGLVVITPTAVIAEDIGNTPQEAGKFSLGRSVKETLSSPLDIDFFKFSINTDRKDPTNDTSGNLKMTLSQKAPPSTNAPSNSGWRVDLYTQEDLANSLYTATLAETSLKTEFEQGLAPGVYYLKVSSIDETSFPALEYTLSSKWEKSTHYEKQPNHDPDHATKIKVNEVYYGNLSSVDGDVDYFSFSLQAPDLVTINLNQDTPGADPTSGWQLGLVQTQQVFNIPATTLGGSLQANLDIGTHYFFVGPMPQPQTEPVSEEDQPLNEKRAPVGRRYQISVQAPSVPPPPVDCSFGYIYAQNPQTLNWGIFPTPCDIPPGWASSPTAPQDYEVCPSPHATYTQNEEGIGTLKIPLLDYEDKEVGKYTLRVEMQNAVPFEFPPSQFQVSSDKLRVIRFEAVEIPEVEVPETVPTQ